MDKNMLLAKLTGEFKDLAPKSTDLELSTFNNIERIHDWRNYIPDEVREVWNELSMESKLVAALMAQAQAGSEEWD